MPGEYPPPYLVPYSHTPLCISCARRVPPSLSCTVLSHASVHILCQASTPLLLIIILYRTLTRLCAYPVQHFVGKDGAGGGSPTRKRAVKKEKERSEGGSIGLSEEDEREMRQLGDLYRHGLMLSTSASAELPALHWGRAILTHMVEGLKEGKEARHTHVIHTSHSHVTFTRPCRITWSTCSGREMRHFPRHTSFTLCRCSRL